MSGVMAYNEQMKRIGFVGPGKVGYSFGRHIAERSDGSFEVAGYFGRGIEDAREAAAFVGGRAFETPEELVSVCDMLLLTVPDKQISAAWESLYVKLPDRSDPLYVGHCSGSQSSKIFQPKPGCYFGSVHPILAVHDKESSYKNFAVAYFTIEGDEEFASIACDLLSALGNPFNIIDASKKTQYHTASVIVSNLVCALAYQGAETFKACGLDEAFADKAWRSLFRENAENIASLGPILALTGPVERGDADTVSRHLEALSGDVRETYLLLSRTLIEAAQKKNPDRDYSDLIKLLGDNKNE